MGRYNEELTKAGVMLAREGLHPSSKGTRVRFSGEQRTVIDGPFAETKELVAGFWLWKCASLPEAIEWAKRCPNPMPGEGRSWKSARCSRPRISGLSLGPSGASRRSGCASKREEPSPMKFRLLVHAEKQLLADAERDKCYVEPKTSKVAIPPDKPEDWPVFSSST